MRILFSHRIRARDGQAVHLEALVAALRDEGHEVLVVGPRSYEQDAFGGEGRGLAILRRLCPAAAYELLELTYNVPAVYRLLRAHRRFRAELVYERYNLFFFGGLALKWLYRAPFYLEINAPLAEERASHGNLSLKRLALFLERGVWRRADHVYPVTGVLADYAVAAGVRRDAITVNPNGVDRNQYTVDAPCEPPRGKAITLGFVGFLRTWHGMDTVISLLSEIRSRHDLRLVIVGDGPAVPELVRQVSALQLDDKVEFLGLVPRDRVAGVIRSFDIALQPRCVPYASPLKLFEYMGLGRAIIAPDQPNIREILAHERNALLFEPNDSSSLREAIVRLAADASLRRALGTQARQDILDRDYTWAGNAKRIVETYSRTRAPGGMVINDMAGARSL
jgi:glycosyltransferase involved in cell wall biosynthesis